MFYDNRMFRWLTLIFLCLPLFSYATIPVNSMVIFGDSLSDTGNTTHLLKSLRQEESPAFLVAPFKHFVLNKMNDFANDYYVPQRVLDAGLGVVTHFFDTELAPYLANLVGQIKLVPLLPGKPYWHARFSNGRVWNEYLAQNWSVSMTDEKSFNNRAFGGSWAATYDYQLTVWNLIRHPIATIKSLIVGKLIPPSLGLTVQAYLLENNQLNSKSIYFVFAGTSDYLSILQFEDNYNPAVMSLYVDNVLDGIGASVMKLAQAGAHRFVIMGIPHIGDMPKFIHTTDRTVLNAAADLHNERLQQRLVEWKKLYPKVDFLFINVAQYLASALDHPARYGFTDTSDACIDVKFPMLGAWAHSPFAKNYVLQYAQVLQAHHTDFSPGETNYGVCNAPEHYLFWDEVHPSARAHHFLAIGVCSEMKGHGYEVACEPLSAVA